MPTLTETKRLVDEIRSFVASPDQTSSDEMIEAARTYAQTRRHVNERLQRCGDLLERGHRPEAIALAEAEPNLLNLISVVEFPELDVWQESAAAYGWDRCQPLKMDVANSISEAYATEAQLIGPLRRHRRLALELAPIRDRLATARELAASDVTTPYWRDDVLMLETERLRELDEQAENVINTGTPLAMWQFIKDYDQEQWVNPPSPDSQIGFARIYLLFHGEHTLPRIASDITAACATRNAEKLAQLTQAWSTMVGRITELNPGWNPPARIASQAMAGFDMIRQRDELAQMSAFQRDVQLLLNAIRQDQRLEQVEMLVAAVESHGYTVPSQVLAEVAAYRQSAKVGKALSTAVIVALFVGGAVVLAFGYLMFKMIFKA